MTLARYFADPFASQLSGGSFVTSVRTKKHRLFYKPIHGTQHSYRVECQQCDWRYTHLCTRDHPHDTENKYVGEQICFENYEPQRRQQTGPKDKSFHVFIISLV